VPIFRRTPARITEPPVGACVCASGNQVCNGNSGTLTANPIAMATNSHLPVLVANSAFSAIFTRSKVIDPPSPAFASTAVAITPTSMKAEPTIVKRKNFVAAYTRSS